MKNVLFVDDEVQVLKAIKRIFFDSGYRVFCCDGGEAALRCLAEQPVDLIVSDMRMPVMDGIQLLKSVKEKYPKTIRIILSGYADEQEILYTLENNIAKTYMFKPWKNEELLRIVAENLSGAEPCLPQEIISYINNMERLPAINGQYRAVLSLIHDNRDLSELSAEIEKDQTISAKVLQIVNSAFYGIRTGSVKKAISFIGIKNLESLITTMEMMNLLPVGKSGVHILEMIWNRAYMTNKIQHVLQKQFLGESGSHYDDTAGLLHNIGTAFMTHFYAGDYIAFFDQMLEDEEHSLHELERQKYGFTHNDVSEYLLRWWNSPEQLIEAAQYYNDPFSGEIIHRELICTVHIAQQYAAEYLEMKPICRLMPEAFGALGLDRALFEEQYRNYL